MHAVTAALAQVVALFGIGAGSSLLAFPSAALYSQERCSSSLRADFTPAVVEFIGVYFLGVASVSCLASLKFSGIVVHRPLTPRRVPAPYPPVQVGKNAANSTTADVDFFLRVAGAMYALPWLPAAERALTCAQVYLCGGVVLD